MKMTKNNKRDRSKITKERFKESFEASKSDRAQAGRLANFADLYFVQARGLANFAAFLLEGRLRAVIH